jgi:hypothetical protein
MRTIPVKKEDIKTYLKEFRYYIIYYFDRLDFGEGYIIDGLDIDNINEAFLFDEDKCMHIYREDGVKGVLYVYESGDQIIEEEQIAKKGKEFKSLKSLVVKKLLIRAALRKIRKPIKMMIKIMMKTDRHI